MVTVRFYGDLKQFGTSFKMDVASVPEALRALMVQIAGLREHIEKGHYRVTADGKKLTESTLETDVEKSLHITPVVKGAGKDGGLLQTIAGVVLVVVGVVMNVYAPGSGTVFIQLGAGMVLGGIAQLLTKLPKMDNFSKDTDQLKSSSFSNLVNMAAQGAPVPIVYGEMMIGSKVLSQGIRSVPIMSGSSNWNYGFPTGEKTLWGRFAGLKRLKTPSAASNEYRFDSTNSNVVDRNYTKSLVEE